ncbi:MAG TPA: molybdate ABC transporter substrate-binding protein [Geminicoccaceae bacterium]|nr:molybdate ABC transporter substrate-binding protein [Geminicoccaceae bacterium]
MTRRRVAGWRRGVAAVVCGWIGLAAANRAAAQELLVFAAASLKDALDAALVEYTADAGREVVASYGSSSTLARQIKQGAPADLFISANPEWMDYLAQRGLIRAETRADLLGNGLVLVAPRDSGVSVVIGPGFDLRAALAGDRLAMGDPDHVPAGTYGKAALESLGAWPAVAPAVIRADNVRAALALVARGEAPLGIVYRSDAAADPDVRVVATLPPDSHPPIVYPLAVTAESKHPAAAELALFLRSAAAAPVFERFGFSVLE